MPIFYLDSNTDPSAKSLTNLKTNAKNMIESSSAIKSEQQKTAEIAMFNEHVIFLKDSETMYNMIIEKMFIDVWNEVPSITTILPENEKLCHRLAEHLVGKLNHVLSFVRMAASLDDEFRFRLSPGGRLALPDSSLFAYGVLMMGIKDGEIAFTRFRTVAMRLKNQKMYRRVFDNGFFLEKN